MESITPLGQPGSQQLFGNSSGVLGKDDFLKILVAQLRNQDPTSPMEADQFAAQLAQFSSVEQLQNISSTLQGNIEVDLLLNQAINNTMATTLIGKQVRASGNIFSIGGGDDADLHYNLGDAARQVKIQIRDSDGNLIRTVTLNEQLEGNQVYTWDGANDDGEAMPEGSYSFNVVAEDVDGNAVQAEEYIRGTITGVRYEGGSALLRVGDVEISLSDVLEISSEEESSDAEGSTARNRQ